MHQWMYSNGPCGRGERTSHQMGMEQKAFASHACQGKLRFRGKLFCNSFIFAELLLWRIEGRERFGNTQVEQVRASCHFSFDQAVKVLGSVSSSPGVGMDCDVLMSWPSVEEFETQKINVVWCCTMFWASSFSSIFIFFLPTL